MTSSEITAQGRAIQQYFVTVGEAVARWTRLEYQDRDTLPGTPALLVANHGFGGIFDLNAFTIAALANRLRPSPERQITLLTHQIAWTFGVGSLLEPAGFQAASRQAALAEQAMSDQLDAMTRGRVPFLGMRWKDLPITRPGGLGQ